ncbi:hypothetical protein OPT61_g2253 [Boeremia exigua]|uniref:Uncharacterized protein n=1 Tax=Boeremia exigua TaxID=749465 RepID=A0ACC2IMF9_9PLEO|nr:hypothetical protein OPT61_g2253 [Boeremia exigua]
MGAYLDVNKAAKHQDEGWSKTSAARKERPQHRRASSTDAASDEACKQAERDTKQNCITTPIESTGNGTHSQLKHSQLKQPKKAAGYPQTKHSTNKHYSLPPTLLSKSSSNRPASTTSTPFPNPTISAFSHHLPLHSLSPFPLPLSSSSVSTNPPNPVPSPPSTTTGRVAKPKAAAPTTGPRTKVVKKKRTPTEKVKDKVVGTAEKVVGEIEGKPGKKAAGTRKHELETSSLEYQDSNSSTLHTQDVEQRQPRSSLHSYERVPDTEPATDTPVTPGAQSSQPEHSKSSEDEDYKNTEVGTLAKGDFQWWLLLPLDIILALSPLFFLTIAIICLWLNERPTSKYGEDIRAITLLSPTLFRSSMQQYLTVERLIGCQSLFSSFERQFAFRRVDILGMSILLAWLLSPLGGQASLRLLSTKPLLVNFQNIVQYYPIEGFGRQTQLSRDSVRRTAWPLYSPLYMTALLTSKKYFSLPMDLFDNVRIPDISQLPGFQSNDHSTWFSVDREIPIEYSSALGLPVAGLPDSGNYTFSVVTHYWTVSCTPFQFDANFNHTRMEGGNTFHIIVNDNISANAGTPFRYTTTLVTKEVTESSNLLYMLGQRSIADCWGNPVVVESRVDCQGRSCEVAKMRKVHREPDDVVGNFKPASIWFGIICSSMTGVDLGKIQVLTNSSELVEHWMVSPDMDTFQWDESLAFLRSSAGRRWADVTKLPIDTFSRRLQMAINTFWDASIGSSVRTGNLTKLQVQEFEIADFSFKWNTTTLQGTRQEGEQYVCRFQFAFGTIAISLLLFIAAVVSLVLGLLIKAPDTLGFVSTSARDNPYVSAHVASHLDGLRAARALQDVRIQIGDVNSTGSVGHVAFASMEAEPKSLEKETLRLKSMTFLAIHNSLQ